MNLLLTPLILSLVVTLILSLVLVEVSMASPTKVFINPPSIVDPTMMPATQFTIDMSLDYIEPNLLWGYQLTLSFNPAVLHGVSVENGPFLESGGGSTIVVPGQGFDNETGTLGLFGVSLYPIKNFPRGGSDEYGPLCTITFEVVGYGSSPITLGIETGLANRTGGWIIHKKENPEFFFDGYFNNKGVYVDPPRVRGVPVSESFTVNVTAGNVEDLYSYEFYMNWSAPLLDVTSVAEGDFLSQADGTTFYQEIYNDEGYIYANCTITGAGTGVTGSGTLANVTFLVEDNGNSTLHLYDTLLLNSTSSQIIIETVDGWFTNEKHTLTIGSSPVSGIEFTLEGTPYTTLFSDDLEENYYTVVMSETQRILGKLYRFANWTDGTTNRTRVIDLTTDILLTANYEIVPLPIHNIDKDYDYETIQDAIDAVETLDGHTIVVEAGTYYENVLLHKSLTLIGENSSTTIIDGNNTQFLHVIDVTADNVTITGFTITNGYWEGINVDGYNGSFISGNIISNCTWDAIAFIFSNNNTVSNNVLIQNEISGIWIENSNNNTVSNNLLVQSVWSGIYIDSSNNNTIYGNIIDSNGYWGLECYGSNNNTVISNTISNNTDSGILLDSSCNNNTFYHNNFINNTDHVWISSDSLSNAWNSSYPTGGNYWSDYSGIDDYSGPDQDILGSDGIGDTLYSIDADNNDTYPLMNLWRGHVVIDRAVVSDDRCGIGSQQTVSFHAKWSLTGSNVTKGIIYVNGTEYSLNGTGWISFNTPAYDTWAKRLWSVTGVLVEAFPSLNITTYEKAVDDPYIIWDKVQLTLDITDDRINVGDTANVTWTGIYKYDLAAFAGTVTFNDTFTKDVVGGYWYTVASISDPAYDLSVFCSNSVHCIFDRVQIVISVEDDRIDVGDSADFSYTGTYEYDGSAFEGLIIYNDTSFSKDVVGGYWYTAASISDPTYGLSVFESNSVYCIFDRVSVTLSVSDARIDVGSAADLTWAAVYEYDNAVYDGTVTLNDTVLSKLTVGKYGYTVSSISGDTYGLSVFESNSVFCIFDKVTITLVVNDDRIDVDSAASITVSAVYQYDNEMYDGTVTLNDTLTKSTVGKYNYTTQSISGDSHGITVFESNTVSVVFDRVHIDLNLDDNRIDVGTSAPITWTGYYEYDSVIFAETVTLNDTLTKDVVGGYWYTVASISDPAYDLSVFESNSVFCVFDRVSVTLSMGDSRIDVGSPIVDLTWTAVYEYDGADYNGVVMLNDTGVWFVKFTVGRYGYTVSSVSGDSYGLSVFESNSVYCIFDRVQIVISVEDDRIDVGDSAVLSWTGTYEYDSSTFEGSITYNDTLSQTVVGKYGYETESISDAIHGLTTFTTNDVNVIFDKVTITLSVEEDTIEVDNSASITWTAIYQYDGTNFDGTITLNDTSTKSTSGTYHYTTESISGDTHGITTFESNTIAITFTAHPEVLPQWIIIGIIVVIIGAALAAIVFFMRRGSKH